MYTPNLAAQGSAIAMISFFSFFLDVAGFVYTSEIFPSHRPNGQCNYYYNLASGRANCFQKHWMEVLYNFILITAIGDRCVFLFCPDTKHKPLEEIATLFGDQELVVVHQSESMSQKPSRPYRETRLNLIRISISCSLPRLAGLERMTG